MKVAGRLLSGLAGLAAAVVLSALVLAWHQGYRVYIVHTGSMIPAFRPGVALVDRPVRGPVRRGEIITFRYGSGPDQVVTHRVASDTDGAIRTKGDANPTRDPWTLLPAQVVGTPVAIVPYAGYVLVYLSQPDGLASVTVFVVTTWLLWSLCFPSDAAEPGEQPYRRRRARGRHAAPPRRRRVLEPIRSLLARPGPRRPRPLGPEPAARLATIGSPPAFALMAQLPGRTPQQAEITPLRISLWSSHDLARSSPQLRVSGDDRPWTRHSATRPGSSRTRCDSGQ